MSDQLFPTNPQSNWLVVPNGVNTHLMSDLTSDNGYYGVGETLVSIDLQVDYGAVRITAKDWPGAPAFGGVILRPEDGVYVMNFISDDSIPIPAGAKLVLRGGNLPDPAFPDSSILVNMIVKRASTAS